MGTNQNSSEENSSQTSDNTINNSFRLVAIRPYAGSSDEALKALHKETTYFLVGDYIDKYENGEWHGIKKSSEVPLPDDFFSVNVLDENKQSLEMPFVNISAIVGKNGCGKSSLIEFLIRLINNFAIKEEFSPSQDSEYAEETYGRVYYETDNQLHYIGCKTPKQKKGEINIEYSDNSINKKDFFYSIISNYSLYGYNCNDKDKSWFDDLFHKNDSYQMPVVITPMRDEGNIDINIENYLARLRLLSIFSQTKDYKDKNINEKKHVYGVAMSLNSSSKLINYIKKEFSKNKSNDYGLKPRVQDFKEYMRRSESGENTDGFFSKTEFNNEINLWTTFDKNFWTKYSSLINHANLIAKDLLPEDTDHAEMYEYFDLLPTILKHRDLDSNDVVKKSVEYIKKICKFINSLQFQRLMMIIYICDVWDNEHILGDINCAQAFSELDQNHESTDTKVQAYLYVIYKTISIFETYRPYNTIFDFDLNGFVLFDGTYKDGTSFTGNLDECFKQILDKNKRIKVNYKSLKLRQTLNFLTIEGLADKYNSFLNVSPNTDMPYYFSFDELYDIREKYSNQVHGDTLSLLPPPIFTIEILLKENSNAFKLSSMSSGELQMLYSVGSLIYHLRNLDYNVSNESLIQYKYINIILEEVEQYFHPEYQQNYVHTLLTYIANTCLKNIKGINIVLVTHSPFVLSDIPKQNVLFLEGGIPTYSMQQNTFGANIHSMLKNGFFLNGLPIGEFAKEKINELTKRLNNGVHVDDDDSILDTIKLVGEPIVKSQLLKMYNDYKLANSYEDRIKKLEAKIAKLEKKYDKD